MAGGFLAKYLVCINMGSLLQVSLSQGSKSNKYVCVWGQSWNTYTGGDFFFVAKYCRRQDILKVLFECQGIW